MCHWAITCSCSLLLLHGQMCHWAITCSFQMAEVVSRKWLDFMVWERNLKQMYKFINAVLNLESNFIWNSEHSIGYIFFYSIMGIPTAVVFPNYCYYYKLIIISLLYSNWQMMMVLHSWLWFVGIEGHVRIDLLFNRQHYLLTGPGVLVRLWSKVDIVGLLAWENLPSLILWLI